MMQLPVFLRDTVSTIKDRIAASQNSLPKYIFISQEDLNLLDEMKVHGEGRFQFIDLLSSIRETIEKGQTFSIFYKSNDNQTAQIIQKNNLQENIAKLWLYFYTKHEEAKKKISIDFIKSISDYEFDMAQQEMNVKSKESLPEPFENNMEAFLELLTNAIEANKTKVSRLVEQMSDERLRTESKAIGGVEIVSLDYELIIKLSDFTLNEIFDAITLNRKIPFAFVNSYFKILKDFKPEENWFMENNELIAHDNIIRMRVTLDLGKTYTEVLAQINKENKQLKVIFELKNRSLESQFIETILSTMDSIHPELLQKKVDHINALVYVENQTFNKYVFSHLTMNHPRFSSSMYIDERRNASTKASVNSLYVNYMVNSNDEFLSAYLTPEANNKLRVKIVRAPSLEDIYNFQRSLAVFLSIYDQESQGILKLYEDFLGKNVQNAPREKEVGVVKDDRLKDLAPDVFTTGEHGYVRSCQPKTRLPNIISDTEKDQYLSTMIFPKSPEEGIQRIYGCKNKQYSHIGLMNYKNNKYNYLPCCFTKPQLESEKDNVYKRYMAGFVGRREPTVKQHRLIETNKILNYNHAGSLESFPGITKVMNMFLTKETDGFLRYGMDRTKKSFLQCILDALQIQYPKETAEQRMLFLNQEMDLISQDENLLTCSRQENPDKTVKEISDLLRDKNTYLNPRLYYRILEEKYRCKIYFFTSDALGIPHHLKNYLVFENTLNRPTILVVEHLGSESDKIEIDMFPQCELVVLNKSSIYQTIFTNQEISLLHTIFSRITKSFFKNKEKKLSQFSLESLSLSIKAQIIDAFGKTVALLHASGVLLFLENPIAPLLLPEISISNIETKDVNEVITIFSSLLQPQSLKKFQEEKPMTDLLELSLESEPFLFYIPIRPTESDTIRLDITNSKNPGLTIPESNSLSGLNIYNANKKITWYISEYVLFMFSLNLKKDNISNITEEIITSFVNSKTIEDEDRIEQIGFSLMQNQNPFSKKFDLTSSNILLKSGKICIPNETRSKLIYLIKLRLNNDLNEVLEYNTREFMKTYIQNILDFQIIPTQILLNSLKAVKKYIKEIDVSFLVHDKVDRSGQFEPYFFYNKLVKEDTCFIAQNVSDKKEINHLMNNWSLYRINNTDDFYELTSENFSVFSYTSPNDIVNIQDHHSLPCVLGYKIKNKLQFTGLLA